MARRRILYILVLLSCTIFFWAYQKWLAWLLLLAVLCLPVLSLILSLPGMFGLKLQMTCPVIVERGEKIWANVKNRAWFPVPQYGCLLSVSKPLTKTAFKIRNAEPIPTAHCGKLYYRVEKVEVSDYLGLFRFRLGTDLSGEITVRPKPVVLKQSPQMQRQLAVVWKPKPGGGFAENHEVRLYRPGDNLNQIHWKLSAKTGQLVIREPMIPQGQRVVVGLCVFGTEDELDVKFDRLMGVCTHLLEQNMPFELCAISAQGQTSFSVHTEQDLTEAVDKVLGMEPAAQEQELADPTAGIYWIGGRADGK